VERGQNRKLTGATGPSHRRDGHEQAEAGRPKSPPTWRGAKLARCTVGSEREKTVHGIFHSPDMAAKRSNTRRHPTHPVTSTDSGREEDRPDRGAIQAGGDQSRAVVLRPDTSRQSGGPTRHRQAWPRVVVTSQRAPWVGWSAHRVLRGQSWCRGLGEFPVHRANSRV